MTKKRRWIQVYEDELDDVRLSNISSDCYRFYMRLRLLVNRVKSENGTIQMDRRALAFCACRDTFSKALRIAEEGEDVGLYSMSRGCKHVADRLCTHCAPKVHSQCTRSALIVHVQFALCNPLKSLTLGVPTKTNTKTNKEIAKPAKKLASSETLTALPELDPDWISERCLPHNNPTGRPVHPAQFRIWLAWCWNVKGMGGKGYKAAGFKRAVTTRWWPNLNRFRRDGEPSDLQRALDWYERLQAANERATHPPVDSTLSPPISSDDLAAAKDLFA